MNDVLLVIDADYICHRARYSMGELSWKGLATGVVYGFLSAVVQLEERFDTNRIAFCFDSHASERKKIYPAYKANRKHNQPLTDKEEEFEREFRQQVLKLRKEYLPEIGFRNVFWQKGYESDDLMASICQEFSSRPRESTVVVVTADQDLFQCIRPNVSVFNPQKQENMTLQRFHKTYGITPLSWIAVKSIAGCSSDNIPGVKGIGETLALHWIKHELPESSKAFTKIKAWQKTKEAKVTTKLVQLPFPGTIIPEWREDNIDVQGWASVCRKLSFKNLRMPRRQRER
jgi:DNA polymerase-1